MLTILLVHENPRLLEGFQDLMRGTGIDLVSALGTEDARRLLHGVELNMALLDVDSLGDSAYDFCEYLKFRQIQRIPVILIAGVEKSLDKSEAERCGADGWWIRPTWKPIETLSGMLNYLQNTAGEIVPTKQTLMLLGLLTQRSRTIMLEQVAPRYELPQLDGLMRQMGMLVGIPMANSQATFAVKMLRSNPDFVHSVAARLSSELPVILWVEFIENLIDFNQCILTGLGHFNLKEDDVAIAFDPDQTLIDGLPPNLSFAPRPLTLAAIELANEHMAAHFENFSGTNEESDVKILGDALLDLTKHAERNHILQLLLEVKDSDALTIFAHVAAYVSYCSYLIRIARRLASKGVEEVPSIGTFVRQRGGVNFVASARLLRLLAANIPQLAMA